MIITKLTKRHHKQFGCDKYLIQNAYDKTILPSDILENESDMCMIKASFPYLQGYHGVIKISYKLNANKTEYEIATRLTDIPGFIKIICLINYKPNEYDICDDKILILPYISDGSIKKNTWNTLNTHILKSIIKQCILSLMYAYIEYGFLHNDLHTDNILYEKTKLDTIIYKDFEIQTYGYRVVIMDFDSCFIDVDRMSGIDFYWRNIDTLFSRIKCDLNYIQFINIDKIFNFIYYARLQRVDPKFSKDLLKYVDNLHFTIMRKELI